MSENGYFETVLVLMDTEHFILLSSQCLRASVVNPSR